MATGQTELRSAIRVPSETNGHLGLDCPNCATHLPATSSYCFHCGAEVNPVGRGGRATLSALGTGPLISVLLGIACLLAALVTGALFNQQNYMDWQAVQAWRIEWLLAGIAFFILALFMSSARAHTR